MYVSGRSFVGLEDLSCYLCDYGCTTEAGLWSCVLILYMSIAPCETDCVTFQEIIELFLRLDANHDNVIQAEVPACLACPACPLPHYGTLWQSTEACWLCCVSCAGVCEELRGVGRDHGGPRCVIRSVACAISWATTSTVHAVQPHAACISRRYISTF